ncbi:MAG TPA: NCS1 family transporter [Casimicrobiaceae bacterium]|nr:NCS1 family transporter [Casimicrobiaceae bacterium]
MTKVATALEPRAEGVKSHLLEESILPVLRKQRTIGTWGFVYIWIGIAVIIATFQLGAAGVEAVPLTVVVPIILLANVALAVLMTLTADIGTEHGLSFAVYLRAPFGTAGTHLPALFRGVIAAIWFGIQTYLGALAINGIVEYFTGFSSWALWYAVFAVVQVMNTAYGIKAVEKLADIAAPAIIAISIWMYFVLDDVARAKGLNIWTWTGSKDTTVMTLFLANLAFWSTLAIDIPNITRFLKAEPTKSFARRNRHVFWAQLVALPLTQTWVAVIGAASFIAAGNWNPIEVIQTQATGFRLLVLLALVVLAQWSTNNAANLIPAALTFVNAGAPRLGYKTGVWLAGIIGTLSMPWLILDNLFSFLFSYGSFLSTIGGIMIADYYLLRRRRLNVPDLYDPGGQFRFMRGVNPAGMLTWLIGGALAFYSGAWAFVVGFLVGFVLYLVLMKLWVLDAYPQSEITSGYSDSYLGTSVDQNWVYSEQKGFSRVATAALTDEKLTREDL